MTHFGNAWNNWGNSTFISNSMPTITSRGEIDTKFRSKIYTQCIAIGESMDSMPLPTNQCNMNSTTGKITEPPIRTWNNLTTPLSGYHTDTLITIKAEASRKADSRIH